MSAGDDDRTVSESTASRPLALVVGAALAVGGLVTSAITGVAGTLLGVLFGAGANPQEALPLLVALLIASSEAGFVLVGYAFRRTDDGAELTIDWVGPGSPSARDATLVVVATAGLVLLNRVAFGLGSLIGVNPVTAVSTPDELSAAVLVFLVPVLLVAVGPAEEYLFRGVVQGYLKQSFSARGAIGWSAVLFTLVHLPNLLSNPEAGIVSIPVWLAIGVALGWLYERTDALLVPVAVHGLYNVAVIGLLFAELGLV